MLVKIPKIHPDEFIASWFFRIACMNDIYSITRIKMELRRQAHITDFTEAKGAIHLAATILNLEPEKFSAEHTTFGDFQNGKGLLRKLSYGQLAGVYNLGVNGTTLNVCKACVQEDNSYHGYYYFRRSHQLSGTRICNKHMKLLSKIPIISGKHYKNYSEISYYIESISRSVIIEVTTLELVYSELVEFMAREIENIDLNLLASKTNHELPIKLSTKEIEWLQETEIEEVVLKINNNKQHIMLTDNYIGKILLLRLAFKHKNAIKAYQELLECRVKVFSIPRAISPQLNTSLTV